MLRKKSEIVYPPLSLLSQRNEQSVHLRGTFVSTCQCQTHHHDLFSSFFSP